MGPVYEQEIEANGWSDVTGDFCTKWNDRESAWRKSLSAFVPEGLRELAGATGLEPAASCVTGRRSNQLNYAPHTMLV